MDSIALRNGPVHRSFCSFATAARTLIPRTLPTGRTVAQMQRFAPLASTDLTCAIGSTRLLHMADLGKRIEKRAAKVGGVDALAELAGLDRTTVYNLIGKRQRPGRKALAGLLRAGVKVSLSDLAA